MKLVDASGRMTSIFNYNDCIEQLNVPLDTKQMLQKAMRVRVTKNIEVVNALGLLSFQYRECCLLKNRILEEHQAQFPEGKTFPAIFGERPRSLPSHHLSK
jgi:hypothetical protein